MLINFQWRWNLDDVFHLYPHVLQWSNSVSKQICSARFYKALSALTYEKDLLSDDHSRGVNFKFPGGGQLKYNVVGIAWPQFFKTPPNGWRVLKPKYTLFPPIHTLNRDLIDTVFTLGFEKVPYFLKIVVFDTLNGVTFHPSVLKNNPNSYRLSRTFTAKAQWPKFCQPDFSILFFKLRTSVPDWSYEHQFR